MKTFDKAPFKGVKHRKATKGVLEMKEDNACKAHGRNKIYSIIVNGRQREVSDRKLTYLDVIELAFPGAEPTSGTVYTVTFSKPNGKDGSLVDGEKVVIKNGVIFNVRKTDKS